jgi:hypothetical protein
MVFSLDEPDQTAELEINFFLLPRPFDFGT